METPKLRKILILYLGGHLKSVYKDQGVFDTVRENILYNAVDRQIKASILDNYNNINANLLGNTNIKVNNLIKDINIGIKKVESLREHNIDKFIRVDKSSNKFVDDISRKFKLLDKLGILKSTFNKNSL